jgi:hypothetical protein
MRAVVVHESLFGNTMRVARAIAGGLEPGWQVETVRTADVSGEQLGGADLLILGAPTHAHGLSRPATRESAIRSGAPPDAARARGMRELLAGLPSGRGRPAAAFDTRLGWPIWLSGAASRRIATALKGAGYTLVVPPESFVVNAAAGPPRDGELERAAAWGARIAHLTTPALADPPSEPSLAGVR